MKPLLRAVFACLLLNTTLFGTPVFEISPPETLPEQSGYRLLLEISDKLPLASDKPIREQVLDLLSEDGWESDQVKQLIEDAQPALDLWEQFSREPLVVMPATPEPGDKALTAALDAASLQALAAIEDSLRGDIDASFQKSLVSLKSAEKIAHGGGNIFALMTAGDVQQLGLNAIHYNMLDDRVTQKQLIALNGQLSGLKDFREPLAHALKLEYNSIAELMVLEKTTIIEHHRELFDQFTQKSPEKLDFSKLSLDVEATLKAMHDYYSEAVENVTRPYSAHTFEKSLPLSERFKQALEQLAVGNIEYHNLLGELTYKRMFKPTERLIMSVYLRETYFEQIQLMLALRSFQIPVGQLPVTLEDIEGYSTDLATDPFNGEPMQYSRQRGIIWSVGIDALDKNGNRETPTPVAQFSIQVYDPYEPTMNILF